MRAFSRSLLSLGVVLTFSTATLAETREAHAASGDVLDSLGNFATGMLGGTLTLFGVAGIGAGVFGLGAAALAAIGIGTVLIPLSTSVVLVVAGVLALSAGVALLKQASGYNSYGANVPRGAPTTMTASAASGSLPPGSSGVGVTR